MTPGRLFNLCATAICLLAFAAACTSAAAQGSPDAPAPSETPTPEPQPKPEEPKEDADLVELFKPLPDEGLPAPVSPSRQFKAAILQVPNLDSANDACIADLAGDELTFGIGVLEALRHRVFHSPHLYFDLSPEARRGERFDARLRHAEMPARGKPADNKAYAALEHGCRYLNAEVLLLVQFVPGKPSAAQLWRYRRGVGVDFARQLEIPALGTIEIAKCSDLIHELAEDACRGLLSAEEEAKFPATPHMCASDEALRQLAAMQVALAGNDTAGALIAHVALLKADARCARSARDAMRIYRALGGRENELKVVRTGIDAVLKDPADVTLRAFVAREAWLLFGLRSKLAVQWARQAAAQALRLQPANFYALSWHCDIVHGMYTDEQINYLHDEGLKRCADGRVHMLLGTVYYNRGRYEDAVEWYRKARDLMPNDHETAFLLGMVCTHGAEALLRAALPGEGGEQKRARAAELFEIGGKALDDCIGLDPSEMGWVYDFYVRCNTHSYRILPGDSERLRTVFMVQACRNGLTESRNPGDDHSRFNRLSEEVLKSQRVLTRILARETKPGDADYELRLMARINLDFVDGETDGIVFALRALRKIGNRSQIYLAAMQRFGHKVAEADKKERRG